MMGETGEGQRCLLYDAFLQAQSALGHRVLGCSGPMREACESAHAPRIPQRLVVGCTALHSCSEPCHRTLAAVDQSRGEGGPPS